MTGALKQRSAPLVLALLLLAYIFNFLDRQILSILAGPIIKDLRLSDTQFGLLSGPPFALFYSVLGIPFAYLADRTSRSSIIASALALWSGFTALCGAAAGFGQLFLFRMGVGIGEAGGVAPSYALIADYFPPERRARALATFSLGIPLGSTAGTLIGAYLASWISWRAAFVVMGISGIVLAPFMFLLVKDPLRSAPTDERKVSVWQVFALLAGKPAFWLLAFAASFSSLAGYGLLIWTPSVFERSFGLSLIQRAQFLGSLLLIGGSAGILAGGWLADRLGQADRGWYAKLPAIAWLITVPTLAAGLLAPNLWIAWPLLLVPNALNILWLGPITTAVQHLVARPMRATASASFLLINNLIGLGVGPLLMGRLSDALKSTYGADALRDAAVACLAFYLLAALLALLSVRSLKASWRSEEAA